MRVLLKEGTERATAETILVVEPDLTETMLVTLMGEGVLPGGVVAEVDNWTVAEAISTAVELHAVAFASPNRMIEELEWMAGILAPYEVGSRIVQHPTHSGCAIDTSKAKLVGGPTLTPHERHRAEEAYERGDHDSLVSHLGRLADARDATAQGLEGLRRRFGVRPKDLLGSLGDGRRRDGDRATRGNLVMVSDVAVEHAAEGADTLRRVIPIEDPYMQADAEHLSGGAADRCIEIAHRLEEGCEADGQVLSAETLGACADSLDAI